jgi:hypothetical protein
LFLKFQRFITSALLVIATLLLLNATYRWKRIGRELSEDLTVLFSGRLLLLYASLVIFFYLIRTHWNTLVALKNDVKKHTIHIPKAVKIGVSITLVFQLLCLTFAFSIYPFLSVGMFRHRIKMRDFPNDIYMGKYFYYKGEEVVIADLRQDNWYLRKRFPEIKGPRTLRYYTYNARRRKNYRYLNNLFSARTDRLEVGIHHYNFETREHRFITEKDEVDKYYRRLRWKTYRPKNRSRK